MNKGQVCPTSSAIKLMYVCPPPLHPLLFSGNVEGGLELYSKAVQSSRSQQNMQRAIAMRESMVIQNEVCQEYGMSMQEVTSKSMIITAFNNLAQTFGTSMQGPAFSLFDSYR